MLGRVIDPLGEPLDGKGLLVANCMICHWNGKAGGKSTVSSVNQLVADAD